MNFKVIELIIIGIVIPSIVIIYKLAGYTLIILWIISLYCLVIHIKYNRNKIKDIFLFKEVNRKNLRLILFRWIIISICLTFFTYHFFPDKFLFLQKNNPNFIWLLFIFYPFFSALPQEFIFCTFFFNRYKNIITPAYTPIMSALFFTFSHFFFINLIAPTLSIFAGLIFAHTYRKTNSLALVTLEHSLYGNTLFYIGLGYYFWGGSIN
jgi:hypothetical protein|tara:strand:+ start:854 stop:1480 length:627 start_codon:yes stop_codon:yes gene_type:complete